MQTELAIVGAGPAGMSCAIEAARAGVQVTMVDENARPGGQLFKQIHKFFGSREHMAGVRGYEIGRQLLGEVEQLGVKVLLDSVAYGFFPPMALGVATDRHSFALAAKAVAVCSGAVENSLIFPGWTMPGVMTVGAVQTMINIHRVLPGRRVVIIGAGNVGLVVGFQIVQAGGEVVAVVDAAPKTGGYYVHLAKLKRTGTPVHLSHTILTAEGRERVERVVLAPLGSDGKPEAERAFSLAADLVCLAVGLSPRINLLQMAESRLEVVPELGGLVPCHDANMMTGTPGLFVAGDVAGVEEASTAMEEGRLAGIAAAEFLGKLEAAEAQAKKDAVRRRLEALRTGPFGAARFKAKERLMRVG